MKLYLITGFLGAGKTTFLQNIIRENKDSKFGIIMNEFGKTGIDGRLVKDQANALIEINRGSIFCDCLKLSFIESLQEMAMSPVDIVFVEGSGLADPSNIVEILDAASLVVGDAYAYCGSICIVDTAHFTELHVDMASIARQIEFSHLAVLNKSDLADEATLLLVEREIKKINPEIQTVRSAFGKLPFDLLGMDMLSGQMVKSESSTNKVDNKPFTLTLTFSDPLDENKLRELLEQMALSAWRAKGFARLREGIVKVDMVAGRIDMEPAFGEEPNEIVFLSKVGNRIVRVLADQWTQTMGQLEMKLRN